MPSPPLPASQDFGLCIPGREVNPVSGGGGLTALLHPGRIGRLFIKCPESALINFEDGAKGQTLTTEKLSISPFLLLKVFKW